MWITTRKGNGENNTLITVTITADSKEDLIEGLEQTPQLIKDWMSRNNNASYNEIKS